MENPFAGFRMSSSVAPPAKARRAEPPAGPPQATAAPEVRLTEDQDRVVRHALTLPSMNLCILGKAGVGKTVTLRAVRKALEESGRSVAVVSAYAGAAFNAGGVTVHSFLGPLPKKCTWTTREEFKQVVAEVESDALRDHSQSSSTGWFIMAHKKRQMGIQGLSVLIIDELSLLTPELVEFLDRVLKAVRRNKLPSGGLKVIMVGDPCQIPPIPIRGEDVKYAFESPIFRDLRFEYCVLKKVMRQKDELFVRLLDHVSKGQRCPFPMWPEELREALLARVNAPVLDADGNPFPVTLLRETNREVDDNNERRMRSLEGDVASFAPRACFVGSDGREIRGTLEEVLSRLDRGVEEAATKELPDKANRVARLKIGATVVLTHNVDQQAGLFNGKVGTVEKMREAEREVEVRFRDGTATIAYVLTEIPTTRGGSLTVEWMPLRAGYSFTIEKSQGLTLDSADVRLSRRMSPGKAYTALGRVASLDSLTISVEGSVDPASLFKAAFITSDAAIDFFEEALKVDLLGGKGAGGGAEDAEWEAAALAAIDEMDAAKKE